MNINDHLESLKERLELLSQSVRNISKENEEIELENKELREKNEDLIKFIGSRLYLETDRLNIDRIGFTMYIDRYNLIKRPLGFSIKSYVIDTLLKLIIDKFEFPEKINLTEVK